MGRLCYFTPTMVGVLTWDIHPWEAQYIAFLMGVVFVPWSSLCSLRLHWVAGGLGHWGGHAGGEGARPRSFATVISIKKFSEQRSRTILHKRNSVCSHGFEKRKHGEQSVSWYLYLESCYLFHKNPSILGVCWVSLRTTCIWGSSPTDQNERWTEMPRRHLE